MTDKTFPLDAEADIRVFNRVLAAITKSCTPGSLYHAEQSARDVMDIIRSFTALPPLRAREEIAQEVAKIVDEPLGDGALAACDYMGDEAADDLRKAITRALSRTAGQEWRDISSAPKDGTAIYLWRVSRDGKVNYTVPCREPCARWDRTRARWHCDNCYSKESDFTHWMPLPAPPVAEPIVAEKETPR